MASRVYAGHSVSTRRDRIVYSCPCGVHYAAEAFVAVDSGSEAEVRRLLDGTLNRVVCPSCKAVAELQVAVRFHDGAAGRLVLVLPDSLRHRELHERAALLLSLTEDAETVPDYVMNFAVVFGPAGLRALLGPKGQPAKEEQPVIQLPKLSDEAEEPAVAQAVLAESTNGAVDRWVDDDAHTRLQRTVPDPRDAVTERWIAGREGPAVFLVEDKVLLCAALAPQALETFVPGRVELRVQLHRLPSYPLLALTLLAVDPPHAPSRPKPEEARILSVPLDIARAAHRVVLEALGNRCGLTLALYDSQYLPVVAHPVAAPLEENVRRLMSEAKDAYARLAPMNRSFERARGQFLAVGYDRLGRTAIDLPDEDDPLDRPGLVRAALSQVARWSEPNAEAYLLEIRSLPLAAWRQLRARVVRRALDVGIAVARPLVERTVKEHGAPLPAWPELLALQVKRFTEVATRLKPNDLSTTEEADNWELLVRECSLAGVVLDDQARTLAQQAIRRARTGTTAGGDLRTLVTAELVALLERKELRREAAVVLCERREVATLPPLFVAIRRMARHEANVVLPGVTRFGAAAEKWLIEGLKSKKSFMRQGCALALGALRTPGGIEALVKLLVVEPTEIWSEVARAVGDVGAAAVAPLAALVREVDLDERDRIVEALAHLAGRGRAHKAVEALAAGRDALVAAVAQRGLAQMAEVRASDAELRMGQPELTVVRGFSRRFYDALSGVGGDSGPLELSSADLEEVDEEEEGLGEEAVTRTNIPVLLAEVRSEGDLTGPTQKTTLPRERE